MDIGIPCLFYENDFEDTCGAIFRMVFLEEKFQNCPVDLEVTVKYLIQQIIAVNSPSIIDLSVLIKLLK